MMPVRSAVWLAGAPLAVVLPLVLRHDLFAVFGLYHLGFCLVLPLLVNLGGRRLSWRDHLEYLGLTGPGIRRNLAIGLGLAVVLGGGTLLVFELLGDRLLAGQNIAGTLADWGVGPARLSAMFWFMILVNGPAEELYWRGFVHRELDVAARPFPRIAIIAAGYASYHAVTVYLLAGSVAVAGLFLAAIWLAGLGWSWLRLRTGSVWSPLLGHAGAVLGYMLVAHPYLGI
jgi:membrane protease YdiL (CAAX protease family)